MTKRPEIIPLTDARANLSDIVTRAATTEAVFIITRNGRPAATLIGHSDYEGLLETIDILSDEDTMAAIAEAESETPS